MENAHLKTTIKVKNERAKVGIFFEVTERSCERGKRVCRKGTFKGELRERKCGGESGFFSWEEEAADAVHVADA